MVCTDEENEVFIVESNSKWNPSTLHQYPVSRRYGYQLKRGRKVHISKAEKERQKRKAHKGGAKIQSCNCAANCNCRCVKCICRQQKVAESGNAEVIRARKQKQGKKKKQNPNQEPEGPKLVAQLTELIRARSKRTSQKQNNKERGPGPAGQGKEPKSSEVQSVGKGSAGSKAKRSGSQYGDPDPNRGRPVHDLSRNRKRPHCSYPTYYAAYDLTKPKAQKYPAKKRKLQQPNNSTVLPYTSVGNALTKIRRLRKLAKEKVKKYNNKPFKKPE